MYSCVVISLAILFLSTALFVFYLAELVRLLRKLRRLNSLNEGDFRREIARLDKW